METWSLVIDGKIDVNFDNTYPVMKSWNYMLSLLSYMFFMHLSVITGMVWLYMDEIK